MLLGRIRADLSAPRAKPDAADRCRDLADGLRFLVSRPFFRVLLCWAPLANLMVNAVFFVAILRLIESGVDPLALGLVETAAGACGILGALVAPWLIDRFATGRLTVVVAWSFVPLMVPLVFWNHPAVVGARSAVGVFLNPAGQRRHRGLPGRRHAPSSCIGRVRPPCSSRRCRSCRWRRVLAGCCSSTLGGARRRRTGRPAAPWSR